MKKNKIIILTTLVFAFSSVNAQWTIKDFGAKKSKAFQFGNSFVNFSKNYISISLYGTHLSNDGGLNFITDTLNSFNCGLNDTTFLTQKYNKDYKKITFYKSTDFTKTWNPYFIKDVSDTAFSKNYSYNMINIQNERNISIVGDSSNGCQEIWRTEDGGNSWKRVPCNKVNIKFSAGYSIDRYCNVGSTTYCVNPRTNQGLLVANNFGDKWDSIHLNINDVFYIHNLAFSDSLHGLMFYTTYYKDTLSYLVKTDDGGKSWYPMNERGLLYSVYVKSTEKQMGFYLATGVDFKNSSNYTKVSFDNGYTWKTLDSIWHFYFKFKDAENGYSVLYNFADNAAQLGIFTGFPAGFADVKELIVNSNNFKVYPNPTKDLLNIECNENGIYEIFDLTGKQVLNGSSYSNQKNIITTSHLTKGIYFIRYSNSLGSATSKFLLTD
jgi:hypothetical protein